MDAKLLTLYFVMGGAIVTLISYFGTQGKGMMAAFIGFFPTISIVTLFIIYYKSGVGATVSYFKGMLFLIPAWVLYALAMVFILPRWGIIPSVIIGVALYIGVALLTIKLVH
jgi:uncharacterized membrane protein (GlpM family)